MKWQIFSHVLTFLGWFKPLFWDQRWLCGCDNHCLPISLHKTNRRWDSALHWICPQRAVPAGQQNATVCQEEETHQTGNFTEISLTMKKHLHLHKHLHTTTVRTGTWPIVTFLVWKAAWVDSFGRLSDAVCQETFPLSLFGWNYQGLFMTLRFLV